MGSSPFHGIFSALNQGTNNGSKDSGKGGGLFSSFGLGSDDEERTPSPQPQLQHTPPQENPVGRVAVDIFEQDDYYIIKAPIAGVRLSDLDIEVNDTVLTIRGARRQTDDVPSNQYYLQECFWGPFSRSVTLPIPIDARKVRATFSKDCVLKILIPKEEKVKIVRINEA